MGKKKIAIIGSGVSGLATAYHLHETYDVTIFEKENRLGGHTDTHELNIGGKLQPIDSAFIIFCREHYPYFTAMLDQLNVETQVSDMSLSVWNKQSGLVYNATTLNKLFCQRRNLINWRFYRMLFDLVRFYKQAPNILNADDHTTTVKQYLEQHHYSNQFAYEHLFPIISALWSATPEHVEQFPIRHLVEFMKSHSMMKLLFRPQWRVIKGGSASYIKALQTQINCTWKEATPVTKVQRYGDNVKIITANGEHDYDAVVFATHADQALALLEEPSQNEQKILSKIKFQPNQVVIHTDDSILHPNKLSWASWNTQITAEDTYCSATYWMNLLQKLKTATNVFVSLNPQFKIDKSKILKIRYYEHAIFSAESVAAQKKHHLINGQQNTFYVGAYWGWGIHEDGAKSAFEASQLIRTLIK